VLRSHCWSKTTNFDQTMELQWLPFEPMGATKKHTRMMRGCSLRLPHQLFVAPRQPKEAASFVHFPARFCIVLHKAHGLDIISRRTWTCHDHVDFSCHLKAHVLLHFGTLALAINSLSRHLHHLGSKPETNVVVLIVNRRKTRLM
jgi:hypothetical protein